MNKLQRILAALMALVIFATPYCLASESEEGYRFLDTFEESSFVIGSSINGINGWTAGATITAVQDLLNQNNKAFLINGQYLSASKSFTALSNVGTGRLIDISFRMMMPVNAKGTSISLSGGGKTPVIFTYGAINAGQTYDGIPTDMVACFYAPISANPQEGNLDPTKVVKIMNAPSINGTKWYNIRMQIDLTAGVRSTDFYVAEQTITDEMIETKTDLKAYKEDVPFRPDTDAATSLTGISLSVAQWNGTRCYFDDVMVTLSGMSIEPDAKYAVQSGSATYAVTGNDVSVQANLTMPVVGVGEARVLAAVYGADNELLAVNSTFVCDKTSLVGDIIPFARTLTTNGAAVESVKLFVWKSYASRVPHCNVTECTPR